MNPDAPAAGSGDAAGRTALAGAGGESAIDVAGSVAVDAAGTGEPVGAGMSADAGSVAAAGASGSPSGAGAGGGGVGGSAGSVDVAGTGVGGSNAAGSSGQAGAAGVAEPVVHELWTITQSNANQGGTGVNTVRAPGNITASLLGCGSTPAPNLSWTFGRNDTVDHMFTTAEAAYLACAAFHPVWSNDADSANVVGPVTAVTPAHVTYVHLVASSKLTGSTEAWQLAVTVSWTAYGY